MNPTTCEYPGCDKPFKQRCRVVGVSTPLCGMHAARNLKGRPMDAPPRSRPKTGECAAEGCTRPQKAKGVCDLHYQRQRLGIDLDAPLRRKGTLFQDLCEVVIPGLSERDEYGCLVWMGARHRNGYGRVCYDGKDRLVHRMVLWHKTGELPEGMQAGHLCGRGHEGCVDPDHLAWQTPRENSEQIYRTGRGVWDQKERMQTGLAIVAALHGK